ncbi:MAG: hypothetical protein V2J16_06060 [Thermoleophilia bacterium]|jgi:hypothetical protein|nr:hypothetical protein [Thermoleophilia bacterium]
MDGAKADRPDGRSRGRVCRRACVVAALVVVVLLMFAFEAQAYVSGDLIYAKRIGTAASPAGSWSAAAGPDGVTLVAGWKWSSTLGAAVPMVAKYSASGERKWLKTYTDLGPGTADAVAVDAYGSVFVAATVGSGSDSDIVVIRYGSAGTFKWAQTYDGPAGDIDYVEALIIDKAGNVVVVGQSRKTADTWGVVVIKYGRDGTPLWSEPARYDPDVGDPNAGPIWVYDAARDADGNIYVAGSSEYDVGGELIESALMLKFAAADGTRAWGQIYDSAVNPESYFDQVAVRGTLVVGVGSTFPDPEDALVVRYNTSGVQKYAREWGAGNATGEWYGDVAIDGSYSVYVTGSQWSNVWEKAVTMKLRSTLTTVWKGTYLPTSDWASGWYIARNSLGNVYMAGARWTSRGLIDILTIKYSATGVRKWVRVWSAGGPGHDWAEGLVLGTAGGVYVPGEVTNKYDFSQAVLLKYKL